MSVLEPSTCRLAEDANLAPRPGSPSETSFSAGRVGRVDVGQDVILVVALSYGESGKHEVGVYVGRVQILRNLLSGGPC